MTRPRLKAHLHVEVVEPHLVFLLSEDGHFLVQGEAASRVAPYLDGEHDTVEIAMALAAEQSLPTTLGALGKFERFGHTAPDAAGLTGPELAFWDALGIPPGDVVAARRVPVPVLLVGDGRGGERAAGAGPDARSTPAEDALRSLGFSPYAVELADLPDLPPGALPVVLADDYLDPALGVVNRWAIAHDRRWLLAKPAGYVTWLGPLFQPGGTGCWECLSQRLSGNRQVEHFLTTRKAVTGPLLTSLAALPTSTAATAGLLAQELAKVLAGADSRLQGTLLSLDTRSLETAVHPLVHQPQCPACGDPALTAQRPPQVHPQSRPVVFSADGGFRSQTPHRTLERLEHHISPLLGAVSSLYRLADTDNGLTYSFAAGHNFAMPGDNLAMLRRNLRGQSGGKGRTEVQAKVSAVCEAIERYSGVWRDDRPVRRASFDELDGERRVHPAELLLFSEEQYAGRAAWNAGGASRLHTVPDPFDTGRACDWTTAWSLTADEPVQVPAAYVWFGHPDLEDHFFCYADANGNAAGNDLEEAVLQGFCELVERDAVALWWYNRTARPGVDLDSLADPYVEQLKEYYASLGRGLWVLDLTTDLGVPAFAAVSSRSGGPCEDILLGFGAHLDPRTAVLRAITELNQFLPAVVNTNPDGTTAYWEDDPETLAWWTTATLAAEPWLLPDPAAPAVRPLELDSLSSGDLATDVRTCVDRAAAAGLEVLVVDQSRPDIELSVAKVMVPGLRHFWRRLAPGRLYDVPTGLGWLPGPVPQDQLNPTSVFF